MFNFIGKGLVLVHSLLSLAGLALAVMVYFEFVDWGRSEPRVVSGEPTKSGSSNQRIASEYDKSLAAMNEAVAARNLVLSWTLQKNPIAPAEVSLREVEGWFGKNHMAYVVEIDRLKKAIGPIEVNTIAPDGIQTNPPGKAYGMPVLSVKVDGVVKSLQAYKAELEAELAKLEGPPDPKKDPEKKVNTVVTQLHELAEKDLEVTRQLTGKDKDGKPDMKYPIGIIELIDREFQTQERIKEEMDYLQPRHATVIEEARRFRLRRGSLEDTLNGLQKTIKARQLQDQ